MTQATSDSHSQVLSPEVSWAAAKICFVPPASTAAFCAIRFSREAMPGPFERHSAAPAVIAARCPSFLAFSPATKSFEDFAPESSVLMRGHPNQRNLAPAHIQLCRPVRISSSERMPNTASHSVAESRPRASSTWVPAGCSRTGGDLQSRCFCPQPTACFTAPQGSSSAGPCPVLMFRFALTTL